MYGSYGGLSAKQTLPTCSQLSDSHVVNILAEEHSDVGTAPSEDQVVDSNISTTSKAVEGATCMPEVGPAAPLRPAYKTVRFSTNGGTVDAAEYLRKVGY